MATSASSPKSGICPERQRLTGVFLQAVRDLQAIHDHEIAALVAGVVLDRADLALELARQHREAARKAFFLHTEAHGC